MLLLVFAHIRYTCMLLVYRNYYNDTSRKQNFNNPAQQNKHNMFQVSKKNLFSLNNLALIGIY
jgi:hypothetical protein